MPSWDSLAQMALPTIILDFFQMSEKCRVLTAVVLADMPWVFALPQD